MTTYTILLRIKTVEADHRIAELMVEDMVQSLRRTHLIEERGQVETLDLILVAPDK